MHLAQHVSAQICIVAEVGVMGQVYHNGTLLCTETKDKLCSCSASPHFAHSKVFIV